MSSGPHLTICIPTFRRSHLLLQLLADLGVQTRKLDRLVIVDGDPFSGELRQALSGEFPRPSCPLVYVPSPHPNLPFQRYLGWRASEGSEFLFFLDDDIRIHQKDFLELLLRPLQQPDVVGVTARIDFSNRTRRQRAAPWVRFLRRFGNSHHLPPGSLTSTGERVPPMADGPPYEPIGWLRGAVMGCRRSALTEDSFSPDLFALARHGCGLGEDTFLSFKLRDRGILVFARCAPVEHPDADLSRAYVCDGFGLGYARALSRRLLNDHCRGFALPRWSDRSALLRSYLGNLLVLCLRPDLRRPSRTAGLLAGYVAGIFQGLLRSPTAARLTPDIHWHAAADKALASASEIRRTTVLTA
jgi:GT2 family glycosyltransferase